MMDNELSMSKRNGIICSMKNVILFTGENTYLLAENLHFWKTEFIRKYGEENCMMVKSADVTLADLRNYTSTLPFLGEKRLLIILGIPLLSREETHTLLHTLHENMILVFMASTYDKRLGAVQELLKEATVKHYAPLNASKLWTWAQEFLRKRNRTIRPTAWNTLLLFIGHDQGHIASELEKCALFPSDFIEKEHVVALAVPVTDEKRIWDLIKLLQQRNFLQCIQHVEHLLFKGIHVDHVWSSLLWILCSLVTVTFEKDRPYISGNIRRDTEHALRMLCTHTAADLPGIVAFALAMDRSIKNGEIRTENTKTIEHECCILLLLHMLCGESLTSPSLQHTSPSRPVCLRR